MIRIEDHDPPIVAAQKIIFGERPYDSPPVMKAMAVALTGEKKAGDTEDMYSVEEIREIAEYLMVYYQAHEVGD